MHTRIFNGVLRFMHTIVRLEMLRVCLSWWVCMTQATNSSSVRTPGGALNSPLVPLPPSAAPGELLAGNASPLGPPFAGGFFVIYTRVWDWFRDA